MPALAKTSDASALALSDRIALAFSLAILVATAGAILGHFNIARWLAYATFIALVPWTSLWRQSRRPLRPVLLIVAMVLALGAVWYLTATHARFFRGGYDTGVYAFSAIELARGGDLLFTGVERWYLGFHDSTRTSGAVVPQFLPGYIAYLALFAGPHAALLPLQIADAVLVVLGLSYVGIASTRLGLPGWLSLAAVVAFGCSYLTVYFGVFYLSEHLVLALIWMSVAMMASSHLQRRPSLAFAALLPLAAVALTRPEGVLHLGAGAVAATVLTVRDRSRLTGHAWLWIAIGIAGTLGAIGLLVYYHDYIADRYLRETLTSPIRKFFLSGSVPHSGKTGAFGSFSREYTLVALNAYGVLPLLAAGLAGGALLLRRWSWTPLASIGPAFLFIISPSISIAHPWFMRHFWPTVVPLLVILAALALTKIPRRISAPLAVILVFSLVFQAQPIVGAQTVVLDPQELRPIAEAVGNSPVIAAEEDKDVAEPLRFLFGVEAYSTRYYGPGQGRAATLGEALSDVVNGTEDLYVVVRHLPRENPNEYGVLRTTRMTHDGNLELRFCVSVQRNEIPFVGRIGDKDPNITYQGALDTLTEVPPKVFKEEKQRLCLYKVLDKARVNILTNRGSE